MPAKNSIEKEITDFLSKNSNCWFLKKDLKKNSSYNSLINFLDSLEKDTIKLKPEEVSYNRSINHFLLYYSYYPKFPFIFSKNNSLFFSSFTNRNFDKIELSIPLFEEASDSLEDLFKFLRNKDFSNILKKQNIKEIILRDIDDDFINALKEKKIFEINSLKEINYSVYNVNETIELKGSDFSNLRWHLNSFRKEKHKIEKIPLKKSITPVIHLIGKWRKNAINKRDFSYINMKSDKLGARFFGKYDKKSYEKNNKIVDFSDVVSSVLKVDGKIASFNLGFPLGIYKKQTVFAHAIGICDLSIPHLAEFSQHLFWKKIQKLGYKYVNDGPTWKKDLMIYKDKFKPINKKRFYWATLKIK